MPTIIHIAMDFINNHICQMCYTNVSTLKCLDCQLIFCDTVCVDTKHNSEDTKNHVIESINDKRLPKLQSKFNAWIQEKELSCETHGSPIMGRCQQCESEICRMCIIGKCRSHTRKLNKFITLFLPSTGCVIVNIAEENCIGNFGESITIQCSIVGNPRKMKWQRRINGVTADIGIIPKKYKYSGSTLEHPSLTIYDADETDEGIYTCIAQSVLLNGYNSDEDLTCLSVKIDYFQTLIDSLKLTKPEKSILSGRVKTRLERVTDLRVGMEVSFVRLLGYKHHGIVTSIWPDDKCFEIISLTGDLITLSSGGAGKAEPRKETVNFADGPASHVYFYDYDEHSIDTRMGRRHSIITLRAKILCKIFQQIGDIRYDLRSFNCEHFSCYCVTGIAYCNQTNAVPDWIINYDATTRLDAVLSDYCKEKLKAAANAKSARTLEDSDELIDTKSVKVLCCC